jgi:hypothetical protein
MLQSNLSQHQPLYNDTLSQQSQINHSTGRQLLSSTAMTEVSTNRKRVMTKDIRRRRRIVWIVSGMLLLIVIGLLAVGLAILYFVPNYMQNAFATYVSVTPNSFH